MKGTGAVLGGLLVLTGAIWIGQGLGYIKGSFMTGAIAWTYIGAVLVLIGGGAIVGAIATRRR